MSKNYKKTINKKPKSDSKFLTLLMLLPIIFFTAVVPLIVKATKVNFIMKDLDWRSDMTTTIDFYTYEKSRLIIIATILAIVFFIYYVNKTKLKLNYTKLYYPLGIYLLFVLLSWITSKHLHVATFGYLDRYEGSIILFSYAFMFFYIFNLIDNKKQIKIVIRCLYVGLLIMNIIGLFQFLKMDILRNEKVLSFLTPNDLEKYIKEIKFSLSLGMVNQTLPNSNYVGLLIALVLPFTLTYTICVPKILKKLAWGILSILLFINLIGSHSEGGLVGFAFAVILALIILRKPLLKRWKTFGVLIACFAIFFVIFNNKYDGYFTKNIQRTFKSLKQPPATYQLKAIETNGNELFIAYKDKEIHVTYDPEYIGGGCTFTDKAGNQLEVVQKEKTYYINDEQYKDFKIQYKRWKEENISIQLTLPINKDKVWRFAMYEDGFKYINKLLREIDLKPAESFGFKGYEKLGSSRGYIWSRSIPLFKKTAIIGTGADTYAYEFPQTDYVGKSQAFWDMNIIVDKPHNLYIQMGINTGVVSLISFLVFILMYIVWCFKLYFKDSITNFYSVTGVAVLLSVFGFLASGFFNDSVVSVTPVFWGLLGLGCCANRLYQKELESKKDISD